MEKRYNGIIIFGEMGSGKDELADKLMLLSPKVVKYNLSALIRIIQPYVSVSPEWIGNERTLYQIYADKLREIDINILNKYTIGLIYEKIKKVFKLNIAEVDKDSFEIVLEENIKRVREIEIPVIVGGRTIADYDFWTKKGFLAVGLKVDKDIRFERLILRDGLETAKNSNSNHNTERDVLYIVENLCHYLIDNNGTKEELKEKAKELLQNF
ncbi:hypothetical protein N3C_2404 [Clostridium sp. N3C]|uniref:hypothetical protein n=1 Tax=Clostridium sp. N3C TaxID=1776758 RepID=UPI00092E125B|nr:hypothetical protein [Clostridium sp. N3C]NLZ34742.1 hypothetical protein [Clostridiales bacterium]SCN25626.1 hypothetical protein N3C_2404 [Clostridium sp. N3C]